MSICPKNKSSKSRRDKRRANWKMSAPTLVKCSRCGALMVPHRVCKAWFLQQEADCQRRLSAAVTGGPDSCFMSAESQGVREGRPFFYAQARAEETVLS